MQKRLQDDHDIHQEDHDELMEIVEYEKKLLVDGEMEKTKQIAEKISSVYLFSFIFGRSLFK